VPVGRDDVDHESEPLGAAAPPLEDEAGQGARIFRGADHPTVPAQLGLPARLPAIDGPVSERRATAWWSHPAGHAASLA
jgi:hypothetical protein